MQVSLLPSPNVTPAHNLMWDRFATGRCSSHGRMLLSVLNSTPAPWVQAQTDELRERVRHDEEQEARAQAALVPIRSADVINDAERNLERSSRAYRREVARDSAAQQFQQDREALREGLGAGQQKSGPLASGNPGAAETQPAEKPASHAGAASGSATTTQNGSARTDEGTEGRGDANRVRQHVWDRFSTGRPPIRAAPPVGRAAAGTAGAMQALRTVGADLTGLYAARSLKAGGRVFLTAPARAAGPSGAGNLKGGGTAPDSAATTRSSATTRTLHTAKTDSTRSAGSAARDANIERIVRVIHSRVTEQRSHTVMRLAPPELGSLRLQMDLRGVALTLRIDTATEMAHRLLSEDLDKLRHGLEASGIQLERVEVRPPAQPPQAGEHGGWQHADQQGQSQEESAQTGAEHPGEHGTESHPAESTEGPGRGTHLEPAAESLVNLVA